MSTTQQWQRHPTHEESSCLFTTEADARKDTRNSLSSLRSLLRSGVSVDKAFGVILSLIVNVVAFYAFLNLGLMVWENHIIEACISRWEMELQNFDTGPAPSWLDNPPDYFVHLPPGTRKVRQHLIIFVAQRESTLVGGGALGEKVPLSALDEVPYLCLHYAPGMVRTLAIEFVLEARFTLFGRKSNTFELSTNLTYDLSQQGNYTEDHKLGPRGEWIAQICREHIYEEASTTPEQHTGEVVVVSSGYVSSPTFIRLNSLYDVDLNY
ncbi:hypothetical protein FOZ60_003690 [Perkinsus olseni]|uniref:Uncharacterized protein n=1 Tax=Perkinsus olseni TaxID=32597 RepID=A0A7J6PHM4_PEROL|nr:hypothetical protein FOZ60_003690 [Perkinsus olseni]